jgi:hypothetical protein
MENRGHMSHVVDIERGVKQFSLHPVVSASMGGSNVGGCPRKF